MIRVLERIRERFRGEMLREGTLPGVRTAKVTIAVVVAYLLAYSLSLSDHPIVAPLMALLVVQLTLYQTLQHGLGRVGGVLAGVVVAVIVGNLVGLTWWSLGAVVAGSLIVGRLLRLGPHLFEAPISGMLLLEVGAGGALASARIAEAVLGALVGIGVSVLIAPPLYVRPAGEAIGDLGERVAHVARDFGKALSRQWSRSAADHWLNQMRSLTEEVRRVEFLVDRAEESAKLNPLGRGARNINERQRAVFTGLERCQLALRTLSRAVLDRTYFLPVAAQSRAYTEEQRAALADVLNTSAAAVASIVPLATGSDLAGPARRRIDAQLQLLDQQRKHLSTLLAVSPEVDQAAWKQHGALLTSVDRLWVEIGAAAGGALANDGEDRPAEALSIGATG